MSEKKRITVFTPTFNRAHTLNRVYDSLKEQTNKMFLWLIIDDGSSDNTEEIVDNWLSEKLIEIHYYKKENGGKQRAHNKAVDLCNTELFICVDSDDYLTENAVESFLNTWDSIDDINKLSGVIALRGKDKDIPIGTEMPTHIKSSPLNDLYEKHGFRGDTAILFRTDILKCFPFFVAEGENFIGESYIYLQIDQYYSLYILNEILYIGEYLSDGYTANVRKLTKENPKGYMVLKRQAVVFSKTIKGKYLNTASYLIGCILSGEKKPIRNAPNKLLAIIAYPLAISLYFIRYR
jgi:glycosyltransferase involved in cell wall biosynthesis